MTRKNALPSQRCSARAKRTGQQCRRMVIGATVCVMHGQNSRVKAKRARAIAMAEALAADPRRRPDEVLIDVLHQSDYLMRQAREEITADRLTVETMARLVEVTEAAGRWARTALDAGVNERVTRLAEEQGKLVAEVLQRIFVDLDLTPGQWTKVGEVVPRHLRQLTS